LFLLSSFVHDLVSSLLQFVIFEVEHLFERIRLLGITISLECLKDFRELCLANDCVLELSNSFIGKDDVAFVNSELKWQEKHWNVDGLVLAHLHYLKFARVRLWSQRRFPFGLLCFRGSLLLESITTACRLGLLLGLL